MSVAVKRTRAPQKTRAHILDVAFREVMARGFQGVSVNAIIAETRVTKGAFFHHFETKNALGYALVDEYLRRLVDERWLDPLDSYDNPLIGIDRQLRKIIEATPTEYLQYGCPLNNLTQEMSSVDPVFHQKLLAVFEHWIDGLEKRIRLARQRGYLKAGVTPRRVAEFVVMAHEGALGMTKVSRDKKMWRSLRESLREYLNAVSVPTARSDRKD